MSEPLDRTNGKMVDHIYKEMQKGYDDNSAMTVVINNSRLDPERITGRKENHSYEL